MFQPCKVVFQLDYVACQSFLVEWQTRLCPLNVAATGRCVSQSLAARLLVPHVQHGVLVLVPDEVVHHVLLHGLLLARGELGLAHGAELAARRAIALPRAATAALQALVPARLGNKGKSATSPRAP